MIEWQRTNMGRGALDRIGWTPDAISMASNGTSGRRDWGELWKCHRACAPKEQSRLNAKGSPDSLPGPDFGLCDAMQPRNGIDLYG